MSFATARLATEELVTSTSLPLVFKDDERTIMKTELPSESALIADLKALCSELHIRPVSEFGSDYKDWLGVWTGGPGDMPDGLPIFNSLIHTTDEGYGGGVHDGFRAWLEQRGWYIENYDGQTMFIIPLAYAKELGEAA